MTIKNSARVSQAAIASARARAQETREKLSQQPAPSELLTAEEMADSAPFYFVLRDYVRQLKAKREAEGLTLADISDRTGLAVESLSQLETGAQTNPTWKTLGLYAASLACEPHLSLFVDHSEKSSAPPSKGAS